MTTAPAKKPISLLKFAVIVVAAIVLSCAFLSFTGLGLPLVRSIGGPGYEGRLDAGGDSKSVLVMRDRAALLTQKTTAELFAMEARGEVYVVERGARVRVISPDARITQVELLDGEHAGEVGFVPTAWVRR